MTTTKSNAELAPWEEPSAAPIENERLSEFDAFALSDPDDAPIPPEKEPLIDEIAAEYVGVWNLLVSKTNWEKGKVVHSWRTKLREAGLPRRVYSDEALSQRIGGVSPQHVGRLRRVYERFGAEPPLPNLYWSHYQAALDWDDAEEWLRKASDEKLSVAQTRVARWEKSGLALPVKPSDDEEIEAEEDEDVNPFNDSDSAETVPGSRANASGKSDEKTVEEKPKKHKKQKKDEPLGEYSGETEPWEKEGAAFTTADVLDAFSKLEPLPADLAEAFESLKVAILTRKIEKWIDVSPVLIAQYVSEIKRLLVSEET